MSYRAGEYVALRDREAGRWVRARVLSASAASSVLVVATGDGWAVVPSTDVRPVYLLGTDFSVLRGDVFAPTDAS